MSFQFTNLIVDIPQNRDFTQDTLVNGLSDTHGMICGCIGCSGPIWFQHAGNDTGQTVRTGRDDFFPPDEPQFNGNGSSITSVSATGNQGIDGLISGLRWLDTSITYSTPDQASDFQVGYISDANNNGISAQNEGFAQFNLNQQDTLHYALNDGLSGGLNAASNAMAVEAFTNLNFGYLGDIGASTIRVAASTDPGTAYAYYPSSTIYGGDSFFGPRTTDVPMQAGNYQFYTAIHEMGHSLGLKHGHETGQFGAMPANVDSMEFSVMTYASYIGSDTQFVYNEQWGFAQTWMMYDIAVLQEQYGADFTSNAGDTVYSWSPTSGNTLIDGQVAINPGDNKIFATIWDGNGNDTYDLSAYSSGVEIDLSPGGHSLFSTGQLANLDASSSSTQPEIARGNIFNALQRNNDARSLIENAIGGSGNDNIFGNAANNALTGGAGNDTLDGGNGLQDVAVYSGNQSQYTFGGDNVLATVTANTTTEGTDTLTGIEILRFADGDVALNIAAGPLIVDILTDEDDGNTSAGDLSLREAIAIAETTDRNIEFASALTYGTIRLVNTLGALDINSGTFTIDGNIDGDAAGVPDITITGDTGNNDTIVTNAMGFTVTDAASNIATSDNVQIFDVDGSSANVTLTNLILTGGVNSFGQGGALNVETGASANVVQTTIQGNSSSASGGGVWVRDATLNVSNSTISNNVSQTFGGGIASNTNLSTFTTSISNSTISGNSAANGGGGIENADGLTVISNSTITDNSSVNTAGVSSFFDSVTRTDIVSTIIAGNTGSVDVGNRGFAASTFNSLGNNLIGTDDNNLFANGVNGDIVGTTAVPVDARLGTLANNGGATATHLPGAMSSVLNAGANPDSLIEDQRGEARVKGPAIDIGAVEVDIAPDLIAQNFTMSSTFVNPGDNITFSWEVVNIGTDVTGGVFDTGVYFSTDPIVTDGDNLITFLSTNNVSAPGDSETQTATVAFPTFTPGTYYVAAYADDLYNSITESDEANNASNFIQVTVGGTGPAPVSLIDDGVPSNTVGQFSMIADANAIAEDNYLIDANGAVYTGQESIMVNVNNLSIALDAGSQVTATLAENPSLTVLSAAEAGDFKFVGNAFGNTLVGAGSADSLSGMAGADTLLGSNGDDTLDGGTGNDSINGGADLDTASYSAGTDNISANLNSEVAVAGALGTDTLISIENLIGGTGNDTVFGSAAENRLEGNDGEDLLAGIDGNDELFGGAGADALSGGNDNDLLDGGTENDRLFGNNGNDTILGGNGDDLINGGNNDDLIDAGGGSDNAVVGGAGNDDIRGRAGNDGLNGSDGDDRLRGDGNNDRLFGGTGFDTLEGGTGNDILGGLGDDDELFGEAGEDGMNGGGGNDLMLGGADDDRLFGGTGNDTLEGGAGDDLLVGQAGIDIYRFEAGWGNDEISSYGNVASGQSRVDEVIDLSELGISFADLTIQSNGNGGTLVFITADGSANNSIDILFRGPAEITADDFLFV